VAEDPTCTGCVSVEVLCLGAMRCRHNSSFVSGLTPRRGEAHELLAPLEGSRAGGMP
jgi:hypothetical protein